MSSGIGFSEISTVFVHARICGANSGTTFANQAFAATNTRLQRITPLLVVTVTAPPAAAHATPVAPAASGVAAGAAEDCGPGGLASGATAMVATLQSSTNVTSVVDVPLVASAAFASPRTTLAGLFKNMCGRRQYEEHVNTPPRHTSRSLHNYIPVAREG